jgi:hypothetical protein
MRPNEIGIHPISIWRILIDIHIPFIENRRFILHVKRGIIPEWSDALLFFCGEKSSLLRRIRST